MVKWSAARHANHKASQAEKKAREARRRTLVAEAVGGSHPLPSWVQLRAQQAQCAQEPQRALQTPLSGSQSSRTLLLSPASAESGADSDRAARIAPSSGTPTFGSGQTPAICLDPLLDDDNAFRLRAGDVPAHESKHKNICDADTLLKQIAHDVAMDVLQAPGRISPEGIMFTLVWAVKLPASQVCVRAPQS